MVKLNNNNFFRETLKAYQYALRKATFLTILGTIGCLTQLVGSVVGTVDVNISWWPTVFTLGVLMFVTTELGLLIKMVLRSKR